MYILELNFEKGWRGGERQTIYCIQGLINAGHKANLLCRKGSDLAAKALEAGISVIECEGVFQVIRYLFVHAREFDILHCQTSNMLTYCVATKWLHKKPVVLSRRVSYVPHGYFTLFKYQRTDLVVAVSAEVKNILLLKGIKKVTMISDIALPVELDNVRAIDFINQYNHSGKRIIGTMAAFEPEKDPMTMLETIKQLNARRNDFLFFHFGSGSMLEEVQLRIKSYHLENVYITPGFMHNVHDFYSILEVFAFSSILEGLGSSILDAFLYKVPVASTDGGGLKDLVTNDRGLICKIKDTSQLAININELMENREMRKKLIHNALLYVTEMHGMEYITSNYIREFKNLIGS